MPNIVALKINKIISIVSDMFQLSVCYMLFKASARSGFLQKIAVLGDLR